MTEISSAGWLISASAAASGFTIALAWLGVLVLSFGIFIMHRRMETVSALLAFGVVLFIVGVALDAVRRARL